MVYKWYILPIGGLCITYHLLREPETAIDSIETAIDLIGDPKPKPSFAITQKRDQPNLEWYDILSSCCHFCMYSFYDVHITCMLISMSYLKSGSSWKSVLLHSTNTWKACLRRMFVLRHVDTQKDQDRQDRHCLKIIVPKINVQNKSPSKFA